MSYRIVMGILLDKCPITTTTYTFHSKTNLIAMLIVASLSRLTKTIKQPPLINER